MKKKIPETGPELKTLREAAGLSQGAVAKAAGVNSGSIWFFESGEVQNPGRLKQILAAYAALDELPKKSVGGRPVKEKGPKLKRKPHSLKKKRAYVRKAAAKVKTPPSSVEPLEELKGTEDDGLDDVMLAQPGRLPAAVRAKSIEPVAPWTADRLQDMIRAYIHDNDIDILERGKSGKRFLMLPMEQAFDMGAVILLAAGFNVR